MALLVGSDAIRAWRYHIGGNRPLRFSSGLGTGNGRITVALDPFGRTVSTSRLQNLVVAYAMHIRSKNQYAIFHQEPRLVSIGRTRSSTQAMAYTSMSARISFFIVMFSFLGFPLQSTLGVLEIPMSAAHCWASDLHRSLLSERALRD